MSSLVADYGSSGSDNSSSSNEDSDNDKSSPKQPNPVQEKLPLPKFDPDGASPVKNSVFVNPFVEAENAKEAILEKHVKMIPAKADVTNINGKKICWMYRKGRCRFGHNCKYAHDSDLHSVDNNSEIEKQDNASESSTVNSVTNETPSDSNAVKKKKKRPGLSQTLVPGKKVLNMYKKQKTTDSSPFITSKK